MWLLLRIVLSVLPLWSSAGNAQTGDRCAALENAGARWSCYNQAPERQTPIASDSPQQRDCVLSYEKVAMLYSGAAPSSVEFHTGCQPVLISRHGAGASAVKTFQIVDARGSILVITANGDERMTGYSYHHAR